MFYWQTKEFTWLLSATPGYRHLGNTLIHNWQRYLAARKFSGKISGAKDDRPELHAMLEWVREGDTVHVTKLDRLARNTRHLLEVSEYLQRKGVALNILNIGINTATPTGKLMLTMIGAIATFEREMMLERQAEGIALAKLKGKYKGRKPTARSKAKEVIELVENGASKAEISHQLKIGVSSIYRIIRDERPDLLDKQ
jgi:DNA invertase Pin-like site-specific DNA recombinase